MTLSIFIAMTKFLIKGCLMTNEIIDKYIDQQGITSGEWGFVRFNTCAGSVGVVTVNSDTVDEHVIADCVEDEDGRLIANSRKSLRDWIMTALNLNDKAYEGDKWTPIELTTYQLATENIEASLGKPWSQVQEELERMEG